MSDATPSESSQLPSSNHTEVNRPAYSSQPTLSNDALQQCAAERQVERDQRRANGNQILRVPRKTGAPIDRLCARLVIERVEPKTKGGGKVTVFYCIGCDQRRSNNARSRALPHSKDCKVREIHLHLMMSYPKLVNGHQPLQRDWPSEYNDVISALQDKSSEKVITGQTTAPPVRQPGKRKATDEHVGRVPISFASASSPEPPETGSQSPLSSTSSATLQTKLSQSWGDHKLTAVRQAKIDLMLLRFIVCCAIAFSIVDNGFFIDFVNAL
jgi:hypothetical protein